MPPRSRCPPPLLPDAIAARSADGKDNGNLLALSALRGAEGPEARIEALIGYNAQALRLTRDEAAAATSRRDLSFASRDAISGVDLNKEAADLLRFQQAYDGSARILQVGKETIQTILQLF
jgi:flagellar hook-associated protein 1 FlgK